MLVSWDLDSGVATLRVASNAALLSLVARLYVCKAALQLIERVISGIQAEYFIEL